VPFSRVQDGQKAKQIHTISKGTRHLTFHKASNLDEILEMALNASIILLENLKRRPTQNGKLLN
jgi:hypothetical protein